jgi:hypothetical protein
MAAQLGVKMECEAGRRKSSKGQSLVNQVAKSTTAEEIVVEEICQNKN